MMNYELFKEIVVERFLDYMPEDFMNCKMEINPVQKVNRTLDGIQVIPSGDEKWKVSPTIYINDMYEKYQQSEDLGQVLESAAVDMTEAFRSVSGKENLLNFAHAKDNIIMALVNTEQNRKMLMDIPHREFQDLSIIYRMVVGNDREGISSAIVNHQISEKLGMDETALYNAAILNTKRLFPPVIKNIFEVMNGLFMEEGMPADIVDTMQGELLPEQSMYIISNDRGINGAASMLYDEELHKLAELMETDLYIMPSSIHEVIAVSIEMGKPDELAEMVKDINMSQVALDERLSNQVYHYDKDLRELTIATDTPNKRLDGIVAEPNPVYGPKIIR